ncbi:protein-S-isoprenylcysteine O-methyltransferase Ste14 [Paeniglutamicibacter cryotolerans]|uniref:Protein-S-isoprenylcysteine O-methyltransferase Ste14 n=2 Tax=Paeniglutamicibacter cryotolerans TaxID=670079 RepID=A0A839QLB1_9MICC|nr:protein-S-isoprenylcysteine O-methyltransferase Ste14 [Paeniglutamicibacter cryotolerans]
MGGSLVVLTLWAWIALEFGLRIRDMSRGRGGSSRDRGTRSLIGLFFALAFGGALGFKFLLRDSRSWTLGGWHAAVGLTLMLLGLGLRCWAVLVLGRSFRLTVEVDADQVVVDRGPYRLIRHPSYTGLLLLTTGYGIVLGNWISVALLLALPAVTLIRRIAVEEAELSGVMGQPYLDYRTRTKRLLPGIW